MICPNCKTIIADYGRFCENCGAPIVVPETHEEQEMEEIHTVENIVEDVVKTDVVEIETIPDEVAAELEVPPTIPEIKETNVPQKVVVTPRAVKEKRKSPVKIVVHKKNESAKEAEKSEETSKVNTEETIEKAEDSGYQIINKRAQTHDNSNGHDGHGDKEAKLKSEQEKERDEFYERYRRVNSKYESEKDELSVKAWAVVIGLSLIPGLNIVAFVIWAFGGTSYSCLKNYGRGFFVLILILIVIILILSSVGALNFGLATSDYR